uniref:Uncharacterized protein n=1 Tax=viral metagenome TaxID=1070528 RepID=A0A6C0E374_9ZZZZ
MSSSRSKRSKNSSSRNRSRSRSIYKSKRSRNSSRNSSKKYHHTKTNYNDKNERVIKIPNDILYLIHITKDKNTENWKQVNSNQEDASQYPGAYFTLITKDNRLTEQLYAGNYCLIFSRNLLKKTNYHINVTDNNGFITENNTYFPENLKEAVEKIKENSSLCGIDEENSWKSNDKCMNEVVFHDAVSMDYLCMTIKKGFDNSFLPDYPIEK